jgi:hypothetical protein
MPLHVRCILCLEKDIEKTVNELMLKEQYSEQTRTKVEEEISSKQTNDISSQVIGKNIMEDMQLLGQAMVAHMQLIHPKDLGRIGLLAVHWNGFNVMKFFEASNESHIFEKEKEQMRDKLVEEVMMFAPEEEEEEFEDEDIDEDELEDDEDDEDEEE